MIALAAFLGAALAASTPSPEPSAATSTAPGAGDGQAELRALLARELPALPARPFELASGVTGKVEAAAAPEVRAGEGLEVLTVPLGTQAPLVCEVYPDRLDLAGSIWGIAERIKAKLKLVAAAPTDFVEVGGSPLAFANLAYQVQSERGPLVGVLKVAVLIHPSRSLLCQHDEPGYGASFARIVKGLAASLGGGRPDPRKDAAFAELLVFKVGPLAVGYAERIVTRRPEGGVIDEDHEALLIPRAAADLMATDTSSIIVGDAEGLLVRGGYLHAANGELDSRVELERREDGTSYRYLGEKDGKQLDGTFTTKAGIATDHWFARRFAAGSPPPQGEVRHESYSASANPTAASLTSYQLAPPASRHAKVQMGAMALSGELDANGLFERLEVPMGPAKLVVTRIWSRGKP